MPKISFINPFSEFGTAIKDGFKALSEALEHNSAFKIAKQTRLQVVNDTREKAKVKRTETRWASFERIVHRICTCVELLFGKRPSQDDIGPQEKLEPPDYETVPIDERTSVLVPKGNSGRTHANVKKNTAKPRKRPRHRKKKKK